MASQRLRLLASNVLLAVSALAALVTLILFGHVTGPVVLMRSADPDAPFPWGFCAVFGCLPLAGVGVTWMLFSTARRLRRGSRRPT